MACCNLIISFNCIVTWIACLLERKGYLLIPTIYQLLHLCLCDSHTFVCACLCSKLLYYYFINGLIHLLRDQRKWKLSSHPHFFLHINSNFNGFKNSNFNGFQKFKFLTVFKNSNFKRFSKIQNLGLEGLYPLCHSIKPPRQLLNSIRPPLPLLSLSDLSLS